MALPHHPRSRASARQSSAARLVALAVLLGGTVASATAQQRGGGGPGGPGDPGGNQWSLGLAVINSQKPYKGMERETKALPMIGFENEYVKFRGLGLEVKLPSLQLGDLGRIKFAILGKGEMGGYKASDAPILAGMAERKGGLLLGAKAEWDNDMAEVSAQWTADASGNSKGQRFSLGLEKKFPLSKQVMLVPHVTAHWLDSKTVDYYYGVRASEATAGRAAYTGKAGVNVEAGLRAIYHIDRNQGLLLDVAVTSLAKGIKDSSLVDRSSTNRVLFGYNYRF